MIWAPGEGRALPCHVSLVRRQPASHRVPTVPAFSPEQGWLFRPSWAILSSRLLTLRPICREGFCWVLATHFSPRTSDRWVARAPALSFRVLGPLLVRPGSPQTVSGIHETLRSRSASPYGQQQPIVSHPCNPYPMKTGKRFHLFGPLV